MRFVHGRRGLRAPAQIRSKWYGVVAFTPEGVTSSKTAQEKPPSPSYAPRRDGLMGVRRTGGVKPAGGWLKVRKRQLIEAD